jgi:chorismate mutase
MLTISSKQTTWPYFNDKKIITIAGPCSAETEEQVMAIAKEIAAMGISIFRAGIWKPRTRPGSFEGVGKVGLDWLLQAKKAYGLKTTVEVANRQHVLDALEKEVDILWIGARTTVNPFAIQEIADTLKGVDIPVLVKNPVNPDVELWLGAIERLEHAGIKNIGAIHRGVSQFKKTIYRNKPEWEMAIELKKHRPDLLLICDPSHIAGKSELIQLVSQTALDLMFDGLMIETHINPEKAWSDARQQITPVELQTLLSNLIIRQEKPDGIDNSNFEDLRDSILEIDNQLLDLLVNRMTIVDAIAEFKRKHNMSVFQEKRWNQLLEQHLQSGSKKGLTVEFIRKIFTTIHAESIEKQSRVINGR